jgi:EAL domain-containing protein (putative c-di-GMP-specific phosphodiesterase class I)
VVAEGVETAAQHDTLAALGCKYGQGFLYGKAEPASAVEGILTKGNLAATQLHP